MIRFLAQALHGRRARTILAVAGIGTSTLLVIVLAAAFRSVRNAVSNYAGQPSIDLWVAPKGADNLIRGSFAAELGPSLLDSIRSVSGVERADPLLKGFLQVRRPRSRSADSTATLLSIGYRIPDGLGGPPTIDRGRRPSSDREIALDRAAAFRIGVGVGDTVLVGDREVVVSALTRGTNILATQFVFGSIETIGSGLGSENATSLVVVAVDSTTSGIFVAKELYLRFPDVLVYPRAVFVRANEREVLSGFLPLLSLIALLGVGAACLLVGLLVLSVVDERRSEIAVLLALGARPPPVAQGIVVYVIELLALGIGIGIVASVALAVALDRLLPTIPLTLSVSDGGFVVAAFGIAGLIAAVIPVARLMAIDPLEAFRP